MPQPNVIKWWSSPHGGSPAATRWRVRYPSPTVSGDTAWVLGQMGSASNVVSTIVDNLGGSLAGGEWVLDKHQADAVHGQSAGIWRRSNCPDGVQTATVTFTGATSFDQFYGLKANRIKTSSPIAGSAVGGNPTGTSIAAGSISPGVAETFVIFFTTESSGTARPGTALTTFTAPANYTLFGPDGLNETCGMYGYESGSGSFNPTITVSHSFAATITLAVAYQTQADVGASPSTKADLLFVQGVNYNSGTNNKGVCGTTPVIQLPFPGCNAVALAYDDGDQIYGNSGASVASHTNSNPSNVWNGTTPVFQTGGTWSGFCYAVGNFNANGTLTLSLDSAPQAATTGFQIYIWGMTNILGQDDDRGGQGSLGTTPPVTLNNVFSSALVTTAPDQLILFFSQEDSQSVTNITASNGTVLLLMADIGAYESFDGDHDCGCGVLYATTAGSYNFNISWSELEGNSDPVGPWEAVVLSFLSIPPGYPPTQKVMLPPSVRRA